MPPPQTLPGTPPPPPPASGLVSQLANDVTGMASINCQSGPACSIKLTGLPVTQLDANCTVGECLVPQTSGSPTLNSSSNGECPLRGLGGGLVPHTRQLE